MANRFSFDPNIPLDGSLGLIYRLNILWSKADESMVAGDFNKWNFILDRIFCNLLFKEALTPIKNSKGEIINVKLSVEDEKMFDLLNKSVQQKKNELRKAKSKVDYIKAKDGLYKSLLVKDAGLRKFQHKLKIYTKEHSGNPSKAMWGQ